MQAERAGSKLDLGTQNPSRGHPDAAVPDAVDAFSPAAPSPLPLWLGLLVLGLSGLVFLGERAVGEATIYGAIAGLFGAPDNPGALLVFTVVSSMGDGYFAAGVVAAVFLWCRDPRRRQLIVLGALAVCVVAPMCKWLIDRPRPYGGRHAWPSGHTLTACVLALPLLGLSRRADVGLVAAVVAVAAGRVLGLHHWPSDVLGGAGLGIFLVAALARIPLVVPAGLTSPRTGLWVILTLAWFELWRMGQDRPGRECLLSVTFITFVLMAALGEALARRPGPAGELER